MNLFNFNKIRIAFNKDNHFSINFAKLLTLSSMIYSRVTHSDCSNIGFAKSEGYSATQNFFNINHTSITPVYKNESSVTDFIRFSLLNDQSIKNRYNNQTSSNEEKRTNCFIGYERENENLTEDVTIYQLYPKDAQHDLTFYFVHNVNYIDVNIWLKKDAFENVTMQNLNQDIVFLCKSLGIGIPESRLYGKTLDETYSSLSLTKMLNISFEKNNDKIAIIDQDKKYTYSQINKIASSFAHHLVHHLGLERGHSVVISCTSKIDSIIVILSCLKVGIIFSLSNNNELCVKIAKKINASLVITSDDLIENIDSDCEVEFINIQPDDVICYTFTSGSTGEPKGIILRNISLLNCILSRNDEINILDSDTILHNISFSFDPSLWQLFGPLLFGAKLVLTDTPENLSVQYIMKLISTHKVTITDFVPSVINRMVDSFDKYVFDSLRVIYIGGEIFTPPLFKKLRKLSSSRIFNQYGPAECTIDSFSSECLDDEVITLGLPIANTQALIVDEDHHILPQGEIGELLLAGTNSSLGYLTSKDNEKSYVIIDNTRYYKSGDYCFVDDSMNLNYIGRMDRQIKRNGVRIELDSLEKILTDIEGVLNSYVVTCQDISIMAFIQVDGSVKINKELIYNDIKSTIQSSHMPDDIYFIDHPPLNESGKINRKSLINMGYSKFIPHIADQPWLDEIESLVKDIFLKILQVDKIPSDAHFFNIGATSVQAIELIIKLNEEFGTKLSPIEILKEPTIQSIAGLVKETKSIAEHDNFPQKKLNLSFEMEYLLDIYDIKEFKLVNVFIPNNSIIIEEFILSYKKVVDSHPILGMSITKDLTCGHFILVKNIIEPIITIEQQYFNIRNIYEAYINDLDIIPLMIIFIHKENNRDNLHICISKLVYDSISADNIFMAFKSAISEGNNMESSDYISYIHESKDNKKLATYHNALSDFEHRYNQEFKKIKKTKINSLSNMEFRLQDYGLSTSEQIRYAINEIRRYHQREIFYVGIVSSNRFTERDQNAVGRYVNIFPIVITDETHLEEELIKGLLWPVPLKVLVDHARQSHVWPDKFDLIINKLPNTRVHTSNEFEGGDDEYHADFKNITAVYLEINELSGIVYIKSFIENL